MSPMSACKQENLSAATKPVRC